MVKTVDSTETAYLETTDQSESRKEKRPVVARTRTCVIRDRRSRFLFLFTVCSVRRGTSACTLRSFAYFFHKLSRKNYKKTHLQWQIPKQQKRK